MVEPPMILVVEDRRTWRDKLKKYLESEGYVVETASSYGEALGRLRHSRFDLLVLDLNLKPNEDDLDGMALLDDATHCQIPSIIVTGRGTVELARRAYEDYDVVLFLDKATFERERFVSVVREALNPPLRAASLLTDGGVIKSVPPELEYVVQAQMKKMLVEEVDSLTQQIYVHKRNLNNLEEQSACYSINVPVHLIQGIEYEKDKITQKETRLKDLLEELIDRPIE